MDGAREWLPSVVGAVGAGLGGLLGLIVALVIPSAPGWLFLLLILAAALVIGACSGLAVRRRMHRSGKNVQGK